MPSTLCRRHPLLPLRTLRTLRALGAVALLVATGCSSVLEPADIAGTYVHAGRERIAVTVAGARQTFTLAMYDTLVLRADGTGLISGRSEWDVPPPAPEDAAVARSRTRSFSYTIAARTVETRDAVCPEGPSCILVGFNERFSVFGPSVVHENGSGRVYERAGPPAA